MKNAKANMDKSTPYRNLGVTAIKAPNKLQGEAKSSITKTNGDLRSKGGK